MERRIIIIDYQENEEFLSDVRNQVNDYLASNDSEISQEQLAKQAGISGATLSTFLAGTYQGRNLNVAKKLVPVLESIKRRESAVTTVREPEIIETAVMREIQFGLQYASDRNDVVVVYGAPGIGKTITMEQYVKANPSTVFITASPNTANGIEVMEEIRDIVTGKQIGRAHV